MSGVTAIVLAGSRPGRDPFAEQNGTDLKALIPVAGEPMVRRPVAALLASDAVAAVRVLAQLPDKIAAALPADPRLQVGRSGATIAVTLQGLLDDSAVRWPLLLTTADHALLSKSMVEEFVERSAGADIAIGLVERRSLLQRLPGSKRTWIGFRGGAYSGANLFLLGGTKIRPVLDLWSRVEQDRKKGYRLLSVLGPVNLVAALLRLRTLDQTLASVSRRLGLEIRAVEMSDPLAAVDVDKQEDLRLVEEIVEQRR